MRKSIVQLINKPYTIKTKTITGSTVTQTGKGWQLAIEVAIGAAIGIASAMTMQSDSTTKLLSTSSEKEAKQELERRLALLEDELGMTQVLLDMEKQDNELLNEEIDLLNKESSQLNEENSQLNEENELLNEDLRELRRDKEDADWLWMESYDKLEKDLMGAANRVGQLEEEIAIANDLLDIATRENEDLNELLDITSRKTLALRVELSNLRRIQEDAAWKEVSSKLNTESVNDNEGAIASSTIPATAAAVADGEDDYW